MEPKVEPKDDQKILSPVSRKKKKKKKGGAQGGAQGRHGDAVTLSRKKKKVEPKVEPKDEETRREEKKKKKKRWNPEVEPKDDQETRQEKKKPDLDEADEMRADHLATDRGQEEPTKKEKNNKNRNSDIEKWALLCQKITKLRIPQSKNYAASTPIRPPSLTATILLATVQDCVPVRPGDNAPGWEHWQLIRENF